MANTRNGNSFYIDTQYSVAADALTIKVVRVLGVILTATGATARIVLSDDQTPAPVKLDLRLATSGESKHFDFSESPITFPNGIRPTTLSNAVATVIVEDTRN